MIRILAAFLGLVPIVLSMAAEPDKARRYGVPADYEGKLPSLAAVNIRDARLGKVLTGLEEPWALEFIGPTEILLTETRGTLSRFDFGEAERPIRVEGLPEIATERQQTGLLDVEIHPGFADNRRVYFSYVKSDDETGRYYLTTVATAILDGDRLTEVKTILEARPFGWSPSNFGGALEFDNEGFLYVSVGDRSEEVLAQRGNRLQGKILRLNDDGSTPADNPFVDEAGIDDRIYALGVRNPQGLHYDPESNRIFMSEHGPMGGDEVNILERGANYGWPTITYGKNYTTADIGIGTHKKGMKQPLFYYTPSEAISPITVYRGEMFPEWDGDLLVGALKGKHVSKLDLDGNVIRSEYPILNEIGSRIRDVKVGPDGSVFVLSQNGVLSRLYREPSDDAPNRRTTGKEIYALVCAGCHDVGAQNAPRLDETSRWREIAEQPRETVYRHVFEGLGAMPERGLCHICEDEHLRTVTDYMLEKGTEAGEEG